jgi:diguanylate cyclase (GGDEF)-like protein
MSNILGEKQSSAGQSQQIFRLRDQLLANERIWSGFRRIELQMIGARSLHDLIAVLSRDIPLTFPSVDYATIACFDPEYEMARLIVQEANSEGAESSFIPLSHDALAALFPRPWRARLGACDASLQDLLFPQIKQRLGSAAIAPLVLHGQLIGCLNQGSLDTRHFTRDTATDLLDHLAAVSAMCVDNAVGRERLKRDGLTDPLTRVANRRFFERRLAQETERKLRREEPIACMLIDVDHFKSVNDQYGHQIGDKVLSNMAALLGRDLRGADVLARYGGEEFVLLMPDTTKEQAFRIAERLRSRVAQQIFTDTENRRIAVTISIGVAALGKDREASAQVGATALLQRADEALYRAKELGRNRVS